MQGDRDNGDEHAQGAAEPRPPVVPTDLDALTVALEQQAEDYEEHVVEARGDGAEDDQGDAGHRDVGAHGDGQGGEAGDDKAWEGAVLDRIDGADGSVGVVVGRREEAEEAHARGAEGRAGEGVLPRRNTERIAAPRGRARRGAAANGAPSVGCEHAASAGGVARCGEPRRTCCRRRPVGFVSDGSCWPARRDLVGPTAAH